MMHHPGIEASMQMVKGKWYTGTGTLIVNTGSGTIYQKSKIEGQNINNQQCVQTLDSQQLVALRAMTAVAFPENGEEKKRLTTSQRMLATALLLY
jgi:hypothetical protein